MPNTVPQATISAPGEGAIFPMGTAVQVAGAFAGYDVADTHDAAWTLTGAGPTSGPGSPDDDPRAAELGGGKIMIKK